MHGDDLIWYINNDRVAAFLPRDVVGDSFTKSYPNSAPVYNITAVLTQYESSRYNVPYCVSVLILQPHNINHNQSQLMPGFNVSCQTHCADQNRSEVCQVKSYKLVYTPPTAPNNVTGSIQNMSDDTITQKGAKAITSLNWSLPENQSGTAIDYYEVILVGTHTNSTMSVCMTGQSQQTLPYMSVLSEGNYTAVSITAVDCCGQRSKPSLVTELNNATTISDSQTNPAINDNIMSQSRATDGGPIAGVIITVLLTIFLLVAITYTITVIL